MKAFSFLILSLLFFTEGELDSVSFYNIYGDSLLANNQSAQAIEQYNRGAMLCVKEELPEEASAFYDKLGRIYRQQADYPTAYSYFLKGLALREKNNSEDVILSHLYLGSIANYRLLDSVAIQHFHRAKNRAISRIAILDDNHEPGKDIIDWDALDSYVGDAFNKNNPIHKTLLRASQSYNNLGLQYAKMYSDSSYRENQSALKDSALYYLKNALAIKVKLRMPSQNTHNTINNIGLFYEKASLYDSALHYYRQALAIRSQLNDPYLLASSLQNIGFIHMSLGSIDSAYIYFNNSKSIAETHNLRTFKKNLYSNMFELHWRMQQYDSARFYIEKFEAIQEELFKEENSLQINELRTLYETEKKDNEIAVQNVQLELRTFQRDFVIVILVSAVVIFFALILIIRQRQRSIAQLAIKNEEIANQKIGAILKDQELKSINSMLAGQEKERHRIAEDLHDKLGSTLVAAKLHFTALKSHLNEQNEPYEKAVSLIDKAVDDTRSIAHNMLSGVLTKFGLVAALNDLKETVEGTGQISMTVMTHRLDERLNGEIELNLYRIIQELISNILKHAQAKEIVVQINRHHNELSVTVEDDGMGFDLELIKGKQDGMGLKNVESRVYKMEGSLHIDSGREHGTTITIEIPML